MKLEAKVMLTVVVCYLQQAPGNKAGLVKDTMTMEAVEIASDWVEHLFDTDLEVTGCFANFLSYKVAVTTLDSQVSQMMGDNL